MYKGIYWLATNFSCGGDGLLATQSIEARARQKGRASLYDWIVYKRGSKAGERKGEERKHRSKLCTILRSRDRILPSRDGNVPAICGKSL